MNRFVFIQTLNIIPVLRLFVYYLVDGKIEMGPRKVYLPPTPGSFPSVWIFFYNHGITITLECTRFLLYISSLNLQVPSYPRTRWMSRLDSSVDDLRIIQWCSFHSRLCLKTIVSYLYFSIQMEIHSFNESLKVQKCTKWWSFSQPPALTQFSAPV